MQALSHRSSNSELPTIVRILKCSCGKPGIRVNSEYECENCFKDVSHYLLQRRSFQKKLHGCYISQLVIVLLLLHLVIHVYFDPDDYNLLKI